MGDVVDAALSVQDLVRERAAACEQARHLQPDVVDALVAAGLMRLCVPAAYGGPEATPMQLVEAIEAVAEADGATGWCVMIASTTSSMACFLDPDVARAIYGDPGSVTGGAFAPSGTAVAADGGWRVDGRWSWGSGTDHAQWILGGATTDGGEFHLMFAPAEQVELVDTWYASGLRATASGDFVMRDVFVPTGYSVQPMRARPQVSSALAHFPNFTLLAVAVSSAMLGIARHAVDEAVAVAQGKRQSYSSKLLAESATAQIEISRAEATLSAARAFLLDELSAAWDAATAGHRVTAEARARIRLAGVHVAESAVIATDKAYTLAGGPAVFETSPLQRCLRDIHTASQHLQVSPRLHETLGRVLLGQSADTSML
jgi:alkylation response protein AidB-like acyl-CoA dehydrogenase